jgi:hypothetical protein
MSKNKKELEKVREYEICRCLVTNIQSVTGHKTHDIISYLSQSAETLLKENNIDISKKIPFGNPFKVRSYEYYPNTKIYLGISVNHRRETVEVVTDDDEYDFMELLLTTFSFYTPSSLKKFSEKEYDELIIDGMLTDSSHDFDLPKINKPKSIPEKIAEQKAYEKRDKERTIKSEIRELKGHLKWRLELDARVSLCKTQYDKKELREEVRVCISQINGSTNYLRSLGDETHKPLVPEILKINLKL